MRAVHTAQQHYAHLNNAHQTSCSCNSHIHLIPDLLLLAFGGTPDEGVVVFVEAVLLVDEEAVDDETFSVDLDAVVFCVDSADLPLLLRNPAFMAAACFNFVVQRNETLREVKNVLFYAVWIFHVGHLLRDSTTITPPYNNTHSFAHCATKLSETFLYN